MKYENKVISQIKQKVEHIIGLFSLTFQFKNPLRIKLELATSLSLSF